MRSVVLLLACLAGAFLAPLAPRAQPYSKPPSEFTSYWEEPAFRDYPYKGPEKAKGAIFWSHGLSGNAAQWQFPPPDVIRDMARDGWDVVKVQRNPLHENTWDRSGPKHVADLVDRVGKAKTAGYRQIIAAGQSYGGAISLEAAARTDAITAVYAAAPGHGSDGCSSTPGAYTGRFWSLPELLEQVIRKVQAKRLAILMADGDECMAQAKPHEPIRRGLDASPAVNVLFLDQSMSVRGHGAGNTAQFRAWYGACLREFLDMTKPLVVREIRCNAPVPPPRFFWPASVDTQLLKATDTAGLTGAWSGEMRSEPADNEWGRVVCTLVEKEEAGELQSVVSFDAGMERKTSMSVARRALKKSGAQWVYTTDNSQYALRYTFRPEQGSGLLRITAANGGREWTVELKRGCPS